MSDLKNKLLNLAPALFKETPVSFAYLYGSYAKGKPHSFSDLDIGIYVEGLSLKACLNLELSLSLQLDELLEHSISAEIRVLNHLPLPVKGKILTDGQLIYSRDEKKRIQFETYARLAYFDFLPAIKQYQDAYREKAIGNAS
jgi:uncharacterized protein